MRKTWLSLLLVFALVLSACGNTNSGKKENNAASSKNEKETVTFQSENGPVEIPAHPKRIVALWGAAYIVAFGVPVVGADAWSKASPVLQDKLKDAETVSEDDIEKIISLKPDLIVGLSTTKNIDKLNKIAPTITFTYEKYNYRDLILQYAKLVNKEDESEKMDKRFSTAGAGSWKANSSENRRKHDSDRCREFRQTAVRLWTKLGTRHGNFISRNEN
ncbi:Iron(3+)-hydroxamate-binding protein YxeB precursor [Geobacillus sp. BCO2]|nr:Iron(3+)-hydroxamate-binding protein YxeB precursor [Geobacillus sp. BCO2]